MTNKGKIILDLCGGTGSWSEPYKKAGYDVRVVTLPENDVRAFKVCANVHGILAAPPCTEFSKAKGNLPRDFRGAIEVVNACMKIIHEARINGSLKWWAMENPVGFLRQFMGIPRYSFNQWQFGSHYVKTTDVWGWFNPPHPMIKEMPLSMTKQIGQQSHSQEWSNPKSPKKYAALKLDRSAIRAITPPGFARAFFKANP